MWLKVLKNEVVDWSGLTRPELHVIIGLMLFAFAFYLLRQAWLAWGVVFAIELANEVNDLFTHHGFLLWRLFSPDVWPDPLDDIFCTMIVPTIICVGLTVWRRLRAGIR